MLAAEIRNKFINFFVKYNHQKVINDSIIPINDPSLLFVNAGMVPFKNLFLGLETQAYNRAVTIQPCIRAGGKHNDLENVGYTARHHTFFEMLGNFSFGDYFKEEAIKFAWEFLTSELGLSPDKLWVTVFKDDLETEEIWINTVGFPKSRISRCEEKDNFWSMGTTGPCGPCSEIFYDHGEDIFGSPPGTADEDGDRYTEIWNMVFMQYNRDEAGVLHALPKPSIDTGMGLERLTAILQGVYDNYQTDELWQLASTLMQQNNININFEDKDFASIKVIVDHIRSSVFMIANDVIPSNEGRGYVLRRIIRRALRHGYKIGLQNGFFHKLAPEIINLMKPFYAYMEKSNIVQVIAWEEERFSQTLSLGMEQLEAYVDKLDKGIISGEMAFKLYDTFGFPFDLTADFARENNLCIDEAGFTQAMAKQKDQAKKSSSFKQKSELNLNDLKLPATLFDYKLTTDTEVLLTILEPQEDNTVKTHTRQTAQDKEFILVFKKTCFYAESGGQVNDTGFIENDTAKFRVTKVVKQNNIFLHYGILEAGQLQTGDKYKLQIDAKKRLAIRANHSATHLLHAALHIILGKHAIQKGSLVDYNKLRYDFAQPHKISPAQLKQIEDFVNDEIQKNSEVITKIMDLEEAKKTNAMALFGEKYSDKVRVVTIGEHSLELCGGTHVSTAGEIALFKILSESSVASGIRRIEAVTKKSALEFIAQEESLLGRLTSLLKTPQNELENKVTALIKENKDVKSEIKKIVAKSSNQSTENLDQVGDFKLLYQKLANVEIKAAKELMDNFKNKYQQERLIIILALETTKPTILVGVNKKALMDTNANIILQKLLEILGGRGGGSDELTQAGVESFAKLDIGLEILKAMLTK